MRPLLTESAAGGAREGAVLRLCLVSALGWGYFCGLTGSDLESTETWTEVCLPVKSPLGALCRRWGGWQLEDLDQMGKLGEVTVTA